MNIPFFPENSSFYSTPEWRSLRMDVLERDRGKCQLCGVTRSDGAQLHVDHIVPISKGGAKLDIENLQTLCRDCNLGKGNRYDTDWRDGWWDVLYRAWETSVDRMADIFFGDRRG